MVKSKTSFDSIQFAGLSWLVLERKDGKALLLKDTVIHPKNLPSFDYDLLRISRHKKLNWEISPYRELVKTGFYEHLPPDDKIKILLTDVKNSGVHTWFGADGGNDTNDYAFFLSDQEVVKYFGDSGKYAKGNAQGFFSYGKVKDEYNKARIAYSDEGKKSSWWLRTLAAVEKCPPSPAPFSDFCFVNEKGHICVHGTTANPESDIGIRPSIWVMES